MKTAINTSSWIAIIVTVVLFAVGLLLAGLQETRATVRGHDQRIRENAEAIAELLYIRRQLERIEDKVDEINGGPYRGGVTP